MAEASTLIGDISLPRNAGVVTVSRSGMFQWSGGSIDLNGQTLTNTGVMTLSNTSATGPVCFGAYTGGTLANQGTIDLTGTGGLQFQHGAVLDNQAGATLDFQADASTSGVYGNGTITNEGTLAKTGGTGTSTLNSSINFVNTGTIDVESGTLANAAGGTSTGGTFKVAQGAVLDLTGDATVSYEGDYTGSGAGTVSLASGLLTVGTRGATFNFPSGMFQWSGGSIDLNGQTLTNTGVMTLSNTSAAGPVCLGVYTGGTLANQGTIDLAGTGGLQFQHADRGHVERHEQLHVKRQRRVYHYQRRQRDIGRGRRKLCPDRQPGRQQRQL